MDQLDLWSSSLYSSCGIWTGNCRDVVARGSDKEVWADGEGEALAESKRLQKRRRGQRIVGELVR
jgi:hypothetical protein